MKKRISALVLVLLFGAAALMMGCGGTGASQQPPPPPPPSPPAISSISPSSVTAGQPGFTLTVNGSNFAQGAVVQWNGSARTTTFVSTAQLTASISASDVASAGSAQVSVVNAAPNLATSNSMVFTINAGPNPVPTLSSLSPSRVQAGAAPFTLIVNGSAFVFNSTVQWNGVPRAATFVSHTQLSVPVLVSDVAAPGTAQITVTNPAPGGGSASVSFTIDPLTNNPTPAISSLSDASAPAGWPGFPLTANGSGFVAASVGQFNGLNRPTTVSSNILLKTAIPASDLTMAGAAQVTVFNSSPGGGSSNAVSFSIKSVAPGAVGVIERSSLATDLTEADDDSGFPAISVDGRFVVFSSRASTLVSGDTNFSEDVFLRDTCINAAAGCTPSLVRVSVATDGTQGNGSSFFPSISPNGRYIVFVSEAANLVPGDTNGTQDVFVRDTCFGAPAGCTPSTTRVSLDNSGNQIPLDNTAPVLSADGRFVVFMSGTFGDGYTTSDSFDVFVRDTCASAPTGCKPSTVLVSVAPDGSAGNGPSYGPVPSGDGRYVVFTSLASNLVPGDIGSPFRVFLRDTCFGAPAGCKPSTVHVSVASDGSQASQDSFATSYSANGRFVAFTSAASNLVSGDTNGTQDVFVRDTCIGAPMGCNPSTVRASVASDGSQGNNASFGGSLSADGRFVAFSSDATNLVAGDTNNSTDIFLRDTCLGAPTGCTRSTIRLSVALDGTAGNQASSAPAISCDARYVAFQSQATNLGPGKFNQLIDVFLARTGLP